MKLQLDTKNKTIKVEGMVRFCDLLKQIECLLPEGSPFGSYKEFYIDCNSTVQWLSYPVIVNPKPNWWDNLPVYNTKPYPTTVSSSTAEGIIINAGNYSATVFNLQLN